MTILIEEACINGFMSKRLLESTDLEPMKYPDFLS